MHFVESHDNLLRIANDIKRLALAFSHLLSEINNQVFVTQPEIRMCNNAAASQHGPKAIDWRYSPGHGAAQYSLTNFGRKTA